MKVLEGNWDFLDKWDRNIRGMKRAVEGRKDKSNQKFDADEKIWQYILESDSDQEGRSIRLVEILGQ